MHAALIMSRCPGCGWTHDPTTAICNHCGLVLASAPLPAGPLQPGATLDNGRYELLRPLAQGGMGTLWLAADRQAFGRTVVVKAPLDPAAGLQLREEAARLAALAHPAVPRLLGFLHEGGRTVIVMEHLDGESLQHGLTDPDHPASPPGRPYPLPDVLRWGVALAELLEYAAARPTPIVHGDIKPANLVRCRHSGAVYLVDFGAAAQANGGGYGTPGYAAPEQYRGEFSPATDLFGLAATLYHLASDDDPGARPFAFPQLQALGPLGVVLAAALHRVPEERISASELRRRLQALQGAAASNAVVAPDGTLLLDERSLTDWAAHNWLAARGWHERTLAADLARWLGPQTTLPFGGNADRTLDAALATLDPAGFGAALPRLTASAATLGLDAKFTTLRIANPGPRYVEARVVAPWWATATPDTVALAPGTTLDLRVRASRLRRGLLTVENDNRVLLRVPLRPRWPALLRGLLP